MPEEFKAKLLQFVEAALELNRVWDANPNEYQEGYPTCLGSFDDFIGDLITWRDEIAKRYP